MNVDRGVIRVILPNNTYSVFDFAQSSLAEDIKLIKPDVFGYDHIKMSGRVAFWW